MQADVFLSLHTNSESGSSQRAQGIETYILQSGNKAASHRLARLENQVLGQIDLSPKKLEVALILKDLRLDSNLSESKALACEIQNELVTATSQSSRPHLKADFQKQSRNRGVKQALFHVLLGADMPSILVEAGFLSHPKDRMLLLSQKGRSQIASAITRALVQFRERTHSSKQLRAQNSPIPPCKMN